MRILIAEDSPVEHEILKDLLESRGYEVISAYDGEEAWSILQSEGAPQLALLDWMMPGLDGPQVCREVRARGNEPYTYLILITSLHDKAATVAGLDAGADDYLTKPYDAGELQSRLRAGERILNLQQQLIEAREELRRQATHDPLTGVLNRGAIRDTLQRELSRSQRTQSPVAVIMADIDHFKNVNDTHGHPVGDAVLKEIARRMCQGVRPYDAVGRYGGEEFMIVVPGCNTTQARVVAERLRALVGGEPVSLSTGDIPVTVSLGLTSSAEFPNTNVDGLIDAADAALYRAKRNGRNRVENATS